MARRSAHPASATSVPAPPAEGTSSVAVLAFSGAAVLLGQALQAANGFLSPGALLLLSASLGLCAAGVFLPEWRWLQRKGDVPALFVLGLGLALQMAQLLTTAPGFNLVVGQGAVWPFLWGLAAAAVLAGGCLSEKPWLGRAQFPLLLLVHFLLGVWMLHASPRPHIDVWVVLQDCSRELLRGGNPYSMTHADIYAPGSGLYGKGLAEGGVVHIGFPYLPLSLLLMLPGQIFGGDVRYAMLLATSLGAACMAYARGGRLGASVAALYLFTPRGFFVLEQSWTEPLLVGLLGVVVFCACRSQRALTVACGLFLGVKQYLVLAVPLLVLLQPRPLDGKAFRARLLRAGLIAGAIILPFFLWDVRSFVHDVVVVQTLQPFRPNALSYLAWIARGGGPRLGSWITFAAPVVAMVPVLLRSPRTPAGFAGAMALVYFVFFAFAKQAFANYYSFVLGALCLAVAAHKPTFLAKSVSS